MGMLPKKYVPRLLSNKQLSEKLDRLGKICVGTRGSMYARLEQAKAEEQWRLMWAQRWKN